MNKRQVEEQLHRLMTESGIDVGELRRIFRKVVVEYEQEVGWAETDKGKPWMDAELRVVLSDAPTKENCVKHAKAFNRGYGSIEQINRWAVTPDKVMREKGLDDYFRLQIKRVAKELGWRA
jgi:hypothetical protein